MVEEQSSSESEPEKNPDKFNCSGLIPLFQERELRDCGSEEDLQDNDCGIYQASATVSDSSKSLASSDLRIRNAPEPPSAKSPSVQSILLESDADESVHSLKITSIGIEKTEQRSESFSSQSFNTPSQILVERGRNLDHFHEDEGSSPTPTHKILESFVREFRRFKKSVLGELHDIKTDVELLRANLTRSTSGRESCPIGIPIQNQVMLVAAEEKLKDKLVQTKAAMVPLQISFSGKGNKISFKNLKLASCITGSVCGLDEFGCT
ncbi:unnamed protein product, partial [Allacma fusca]